jgi:methylated-DNA-[protein]-cysteine S-methyltransferase
MEQLFIAQSAETRLGRFWLAATESGLAAVSWGQDQPAFEAWLSRRHKCALQPDDARLEETALQLQEYLDGERRNFTLPIDWSRLRPFQQSVLKATYAIPYGETRTYKEIAALVDRPHSFRAVGRAEATNPMPLVIPCHRVIGSDGKLHGYGMAEGLKTKAWLLKMEGAVFA